MKTKCLMFFLLLALSLTFSGRGLAQSWAFKTNLANWALGASPNLTVEKAVALRYSVGIKGSYNWFWSKENQRMKHWMVKPEVRYWPQGSFTGHSFALQGMVAQYNFGGVKPPFGLYKNLRDHRYEGMGYGLGVGYNYLWRFGARSGVELGLDLGYVLFDYEKFKCVKCGTLMEKGVYHYFGLTGLSLSYVFFL